MKKKYSIIIPTYNGEKTITTLLEKVIFLIKNYTYEIIIIDSESKDSTVKIINSYIKKYSTIRLIKIKKKVFNHGSTRNLGVKLAKGEYLCFFSQDAIPQNKLFFNYYIEDFKKDRSAVAIFGKNIPYPDTFFLYKIENYCRWDILDEHTNNRGVLVQNIKKPFISYVENNYLYWYFLSNTSSCYKKTFLIKHPFPETDYGEDMIMGKKIIENGFSKVYDRRCSVIHSHNYNIFEYYQRERNSFILRFNKVNLRIKINIVCKIKKIINSDIKFIKKFSYIFCLLFFYLLKVFIWIEIKCSFFGKDFYRFNDN